MRIAALDDLPQLALLRQRWSASRGFICDTEEFADRVRTWWERQGDSRVCWLAFDAELAIGMVKRLDL